jgi:hypothetical protein
LEFVERERGKEKWRSREKTERVGREVFSINEGKLERNI